ncbi:MAG TPA: GTPase ObgE [Bacteroidales bacterium]|nr:GTPase ObgE [Bacteroidales bacterium]HPS73696.1 GTPase ObgE [Bacteroidales bacterium]
MTESNFVDYIKIFCASGNGGPGSAHFLRTRTNPRGGPDGGDGGKGGDIILKGNKQLWTLLHLRYTKHLKAENGDGGSRNLRKGANGKDIVIEVPLGTMARNAETGELICEVTHHDETAILLPGGRGGLGNDHFKSATHQAPKFSQPGEPGMEGWFHLELKILADVGLVGFPNAGKSTLLSVISAAKPTIADYPFTTLVPNLGIVNYHENRSFVMADIPGIIEGAHEGKGIGLRFLRHIERNSALLFMVPVDCKDINEEYHILLNELKQFNPELLDKPRLLAITKADLADEEIIAGLKENLPDIPWCFISAIKKTGLMKLKQMIWDTLSEQ